MGVINDFGMPFTDSSGDRKYNSSAWRDYFSSLLENGIIGVEGNELQVKPQAVPNKSIFVETGSIFIEGVVRIMQTTTTLSLTDNASGNPRIDRIVARLNYTDRKIELAVIQGTPAASPVAPNLTRNTLKYELALADITLANGYTTITSGIITDKRVDETVCGYFKYKAKPAWYPTGNIPVAAYMYLLFKSQLSAQEILDIEATPSLMAAVNNNSMAAGLKGYKTDSYLAFCSNANAISIDAAFGKNNEDIMCDFGRQFVMFEWFGNNNKATKPMTNLYQKVTFTEAISNAYSLFDLYSSDSRKLTDFIWNNAYAYTKLSAKLTSDTTLLKNVLELLTGYSLNTFASIDTMMVDAAAVGKICDSAAARACLFANKTVCNQYTLTTSTVLYTAMFARKQTVTFGTNSNINIGRSYAFNGISAMNSTNQNNYSPVYTKTDGSTAGTIITRTTLNFFCNSIYFGATGASQGQYGDIVHFVI